MSLAHSHPKGMTNSGRSSAVCLNGNFGAPYFSRVEQYLVWPLDDILLWIGFPRHAQQLSHSSVHYRKHSTSPCIGPSWSCTSLYSSSSRWDDRFSAFNTPTTWSLNTEWSVQAHDQVQVCPIRHGPQDALWQQPPLTHRRARERGGREGIVKKRVARWGMVGMEYGITNWAFLEC